MSYLLFGKALNCPSEEIRAVKSKLCDVPSYVYLVIYQPVARHVDSWDTQPPWVVQNASRNLQEKLATRTIQGLTVICGKSEVTGNTEVPWTR
jgi:hypothetical protein